MELNPRQMLGLGNTRPSMQYQQLNNAYQSDPRRMLGQTLMGQGASAAPVRTPLQGLGRLSSALVGAYLQRKAGDAQVAREDDYRSKLGDALSGLDLTGTPGLNALSQVNPELALQTGVGLEGQIAVANASRKPTSPVQMFNPETREVIPVIPGSAEQTKAYDLGFRMGTMPNADAGFMFNNEGKQVIRPRSNVAFDQATKFIKDIAGDVKQFKEAKTAYLSASSLAADDSGAGDTGLIYAFFTSLDPGGRVTDSETASAVASQDYGTQLSVALKRAIQSGRLNGPARQEIVDAMSGVVKQRQKSIQTQLGDKVFTNRLTSLGFQPQELLASYSDVFSDLPTLSIGSNTNADGAIVPGAPITPIGGADSSLTDATDSELLQGLY